VACTVILACSGSAAPAAVSLGSPAARPDRLIELTGERAEALRAEYSTDGGQAWHAATLYTGATVDEWRTCKYSVWNAGVIEGKLRAGKQTCVWNYFFDLALPQGRVEFRLLDSGGAEVLRQQVDLTRVGGLPLIDHRSAAGLPGGSLLSPWRLKAAGAKTPPVPSIVCPVDDPLAPALVLAPGLEGWHRIYVGIEVAAPHRFTLSTEGISYPVPDYQRAPDKQGRDKLCREYYIKSADMTGQDISLALGGTVPTWHDAGIRYIRFVPMTPDEVDHFHDVRKQARERGRPFAGYVEQCTAACYDQGGLGLRAHTRNEMRLNKVRGATEVYVHVIRAGAKAWYHSDIVQWCTPQPGEAADGWVKVGQWLEQGDPLQVAVEEAGAAGLKVFADMGMNVTYLTKSPGYAGLADEFAREHPECLVPGKSMFMDYRKPQVREYVVAIARELMTKYDVDGINLDFARFGHREAFDEPSLVDVVKRIDEARRDAQLKWRHPITIATRIPSYQYATDADWSQASYGGEHPWFTAALKTWAHSGWIDRVMVCCPIPERFAGLSLARYREAIDGTQVEFWGDLYGGSGRPRSLFLDAARGWAKQGVDGGFFFYSVARATEFEQINWMLRLIDFPEVQVEPTVRGD